MRKMAQEEMRVITGGKTLKIVCNGTNTVNCGYTTKATGVTIAAEIAMGAHQTSKNHYLCTYYWS